MSENNALPVLDEPLEATLRHTAFPGYRHAFGGGEIVGQLRENGETDAPPLRIVPAATSSQKDLRRME